MEKKKAFSLLELIFAIVIIGVIASVAIPKFMDTKADAQAATVKQDLATLISSAQSYSLNNTLDDFTKVITLNSTIWSVTGTSAKYKEDNSDCLAVLVENSTLKVTLDKEHTGTVCQKLVELGIKDTEYKLF